MVARKKDETRHEILTVEKLCSAPVVYDGKRVITLSQIDQLHERPEGTAKRTFNRLEADGLIVLNEDYYRITPSEASTLDVLASKYHSQDVILFNESGYSMMVKPFRDKRAWQVQRQLVRGYFAAREMLEDLTNHPVILRMLQSIQQHGEVITTLTGQIAGLVQSVQALACREAERLDWRGSPDFRDRPRIFRLPELVRLWWPERTKQQECKVLRRWRSCVRSYGLNVEQARDYDDIHVNELDATRFLRPILDAVRAREVSDTSQRRLPFPVN